MFSAVLSLKNCSKQSMSKYTISFIVCELYFVIKHAKSINTMKQPFDADGMGENSVNLLSLEAYFAYHLFIAAVQK